MIFVAAKATQLLLNSSLHLLGHSKLVTQLVKHVLKHEPGLANGYNQNEILLAAFMHDIGKIYWPAEFFLGRPLNQSDRFLMASHPISSANLARQMGVTENTALLIAQHHEKVDGNGYPNKLKNPNPVALLIGTCNAYANYLELEPPNSFSEIGAHTLTLRVFDGELWSEPFSQVVDVFAKPVARFTVSPNPVYEYDPVTYNDTSYDPAGLTLTNREWRVRKGSNEWMFANPPRIFQDVDGEGQYKIGLRVRNSQGIWSDWYEQDLTVLAGFVVEGYVLPNPAERGRDIKITGKAIRPSDGQYMKITKMEAEVVVSGMPDGEPAAKISMQEDGSEWYCIYRVPELKQKNRWPDDGAYKIRIIGSRASELTGEMVTREELLPINTKGHIHERRIIRTTSW